jgi:MFS family permease
MKLTNRIEEIKANGYQLDFANVFNQAFENYKKIALYAGLMIFVFSIILLAIFATLTLSFFGIAALTEYMKPENLRPENFSGNFLIGYIAISILITGLLSPFSAGLIKMAHCAEKDEEFHVSTVFEYYKAPYFKEVFLATLIISLGTTGLSTLLDHYGIQFLGGLITIVISFFTFMAIPLIIFSGLKAVDAIVTSFIIISKQPLVLLGLVLVAAIGSLVGFIGCCIGIFFTMPFIYSMYYAIYSQILGFENEENTFE